MPCKLWEIQIYSTRRETNFKSCSCFDWAWLMSLRVSIPWRSGLERERGGGVRERERKEKPNIGWKLIIMLHQLSKLYILRNKNEKIFGWDFLFLASNFLIDWRWKGSVPFFASFPNISYPATYEAQLYSSASYRWDSVLCNAFQLYVAIVPCSIKYHKLLYSTLIQSGS